jgi:hypothetical protein
MWDLVRRFIDSLEYASFPQSDNRRRTVRGLALHPELRAAGR